MRIHRSNVICLIAFCLLIAVGCGGRPKLAEVQGQILLDGEPLEGIEIKYIPDPEFDNKGRYSKATTDEDGRFTLVYDDEDRPAGASIGRCRVTLRDVLAEYTGRTEEPIPSRIAQIYRTPNSTPLRRDVEEGVINNHVFELSTDDE